MPRYKRRIKLIRPRLQLKLVAIFAAVSALALLLQYTLFLCTVSAVASELPHDGAVLLNDLQGVLEQILLASFLVLLPLTFWVGILATFRIAGPIHRFSLFLEAVRRGEHPGECRLREGDELGEFCQLLNDVTEPLRRAGAPPAGATPAGPSPAGNGREAA